MVGSALSLVLFEFYGGTLQPVGGGVECYGCGSGSGAQDGERRSVKKTDVVVGGQCVALDVTVADSYETGVARDSQTDIMAVGWHLTAFFVDCSDAYVL